MKSPQGSGVWLASSFVAVLVAIQPTASTSQKAQVENAPAEEPAPESAERWQAAVAEALDGRGKGSTRFLVATIPDPELGPLAVYTDETLAAISSAAVDAGYLLHAHALPWNEPGTNDKKGFEVSGLLAANDLPSGLQLAAVTSEQRPAAVGFEASIVPSSAEPRAARVGALIFKRLEPFELLTVLLVGESAVKGVDATGLREALTHAGCMRARKSIAMGVLGPTFSGSAPGMWRVLNETSHKCDLHIITGSATGDLYEQTLEERHEFKRTIVADAALRTYLFGKLAELQPHAKIAVLSESGTQYANAYNATSAPNNKDLKLRSYSFPLHIAKLRSAYGSRDKATDERLASLRRSLDVDLSSVHPANRDQVPVFSKLTPLSVDATLRSTFDNIARWDADYLLVVATDPADLIFLAGQARDHVPGAQLVTVSISALYGQASFAAQLQGAIVASSYPLGLDNQGWELTRLKSSSVGASLKSFSSDGAQGAYNAMRELIRVGRPGLPSTPYLDLTAPGSTDAGPRPWLSLIEGRSWPLDFEGQTNSEKRAFVRPTHYAVGWSILVLALCAFQTLMVYLATHTSARSARYIRAFAWPSHGTSGTLVQYQSVAYLALGLFGMALSIAAAHTYRFEWLQENIENTSALQVLTILVLKILLPCATLLLTALGAAVPIDWLRKRGASLSRRRDAYAWTVQLIVTAIILIVCGFVVVCFANLCGALSSAKGPLFLTRLTDPLGPSPLALLFFFTFGLYVWAVTGLARAGAIERFASTAPTQSILFRLGVRLSDSQEPGMRRRALTWEVALLGALIAPNVLLWMRLLPTFEWPGFDATLKVLFLALTLCVMFACLQALLFWSRLRRTLGNQAATAGIEAFNRIASKVAGSFGTQLRSHVPPPHELAISVQSLQTLCSFETLLDQNDPIFKRITTRLPTLRGLLRALEQAYRGPEVASGPVNASRLYMQPTAEYEQRVHTAFFNASHELDDILSEAYSLRAQHPQTPNLESSSLGMLVDGRLSVSPTGIVLANGLPTKTLLWIRAAEDFVAMRVVTWTYHVLDQIRWLITFALFGAVMLVCAAFSYPLHPHRFVTLFCGCSLLFVVAVTVRLLQQIQSTEILRRLAPGAQLSALRVEMLRQVITYVVLPVLILAARVFPEIGDNLGRALEPLVSLLQ